MPPAASEDILLFPTVGHTPTAGSRSFPQALKTGFDMECPEYFSREWKSKKWT